MVKVVLSGAWRSVIDHDSGDLLYGPGTGRMMLTNLVADYPLLRQRVFNSEGKINSFVNVFVGESDIRFLDQGLDIECENGTEIFVIPALAGA